MFRQTPAIVHLNILDRNDDMMLNKDDSHHEAVVRPTEKGGFGSPQCASVAPEVGLLLWGASLTESRGGTLGLWLVGHNQSLPCPTAHDFVEARCIAGPIHILQRH